MNRRTFLQRAGAALVASGSIRRVEALASSGAEALAGLAPAIVRSQRHLPQIALGVAVGDASDTGIATVWSRSDRASRMLVEYSTTESFRNPRQVRGAAALESSDFTGRTQLTDLPAGQRIFYRVRFQDLSDLSAIGDPVEGSFSTAAAAAMSRNLVIAWSADTVGQGWGINPEWGGLRLYETMRRAEPDIFVHCGDTVYADQPLQPEVTLDDGTVWKNLVTPAKSKVAETLDEYRGNFAYNLQDEHMRRFNAKVSQVVTWDDHEVRDNWYESRDLSRDNRYRVKSVGLLAARARQAFFEYNPLPVMGGDAERIYRSVKHGPVEIFALDMRSYRGANSANTQADAGPATALLGAAQLVWLKGALSASTATWKVIASDLPVGLVVRDGPQHFEAIANADDGAPLGREWEIAELLRFVRDRRIRNVVWITGDVHYCAAHHYDPARARFTEFDPFWEFVAGPLHSGTFGPNELDRTFGPEVRFTGVPAGMKPGRPPSDGLQFFGTLTIDARTKALTAALHDLAGTKLWSTELEAQ